MTKLCTKCEVTKDESEFYQRGDKRGLTSRCRNCINSDLRAKTYKIGPTEYAELFALQEGKCRICQLPERARNKSLAVDHCHQTGAIRGLLCGRCNTAIGLLDENLGTLQAAIIYLQRGA